MLNLMAYLGLNGSGFELGMKRAESLTKKFSKALNSTFAGYLGAAAIGAAAKATVDFGGKVNDLAERYGMSTDAIQKWDYALKQNGSTIEEGGAFFEKLAVSRKKALEGDDDAIASFQKLGVSIDDLKNKRLEDIGLNIAEAVKGGDIQKLIDPLRDIGGKSAGALVAAFKAGIPEAFEEAERLGLVVGEENIKKLDALGDAFSTFATKVISVLAPVITTVFDLVNLFSDLVKGSVGGAAAFIGTLVGGGTLSDAIKARDSVYSDIAENREKKKTGLAASDRSALVGGDDAENKKATREAEKQLKLKERLEELTRKNSLNELSAAERLKVLTEERNRLLQAMDFSGERSLEAQIRAEELRGEINSLAGKDSGKSSGIQLTSLQQVGAQVSFNPVQNSMQKLTTAIEKNTLAQKTSAQSEPLSGVNFG